MQINNLDYVINFITYQYGPFICPITAGTLRPTTVTRETKRRPKSFHLQNPIDNSRETNQINANLYDILILSSHPVS
jgi:hypothetical protein